MKKTKQELLLLLLLNIIFCFCFFYPILGHLNTILMSMGGDGIKNYFCYLYFIRYDQGTLFTGMNYPFGENIIFTDNMPALAWSIAKLKAVFPGIVNYALGIMHSTFIISYLLCSFYLYKILKLFQVQGWWSVAAAVFIAYFSPQFFRFFGHFSLGLTCFFPMMIYWMMQYERRRKGKYVLFLLLCAIVFTFLHVYYLAFSLMLMLAYSLAYCIVKRGSWLQKLKYVTPLLCCAALAILAFKTYLKITDPVTDRPGTPYGYLDAVATLRDVMTSNYNFIGSNAFAWIFGGSSGVSEGYVYLGLVTLLVCLFLVYRLLAAFILWIRRRRKMPAHPVRRYRVWLVTAFILLLFSMGVPFIWGLESLTGYVSVFRQFRSLGRFAWFFYYLMMVYAAIFLYRWFRYLRTMQYHKLYTSLAVLVVVIWLIEWNGYAQSVRHECNNAGYNYELFTTRGGEAWKSWLADKGYTGQHFQGIIGLSYTHIGAEKVSAQEDAQPVIINGAEIAYATGLKMTDVMLSRTSWSQTFANLRLIDGPFTPKPIAERFNDKPFLLFICPGVPLAPGEQALVSQATFVGNKNEIAVYSLDVKAMIRRDQRAVDSLTQLVTQLPQREGLLGAAPDVFSYSEHFDDKVYAEPFSGKGALAANDKDDQLLITIPVNGMIRDSVYVISTWFRCHMDIPDMPYIIFKTYDKNGAPVSEGDYIAARSTYTIKDWFKAERAIKMPPGIASIKLFLKGSRKNFIALDELLLYPSNNVYFYKAGKGILLLNNRPVRIAGTNP